ncbi:hypothetical protein D7V94_13385 [Parablautia intestinalis]|uniref:Uncharacterized protein n=1 Tax=Parablautia intestinalis TaxID=2320100 RepID=A0A3A9AFY4_9FIRM|nr:hypothetical protein [Parablautia intestinalis]RKI90422.1 hypothetical protein D7V94_13385 [Parablautia intestinalis]
MTMAEKILNGIEKFYLAYTEKRILKTKEEVAANTNPDNLPSAVVVDELIDNLKTSFQDGVDTLYNKCKSCGVTPSDKTPTAIVNAIQSIYTNRYNAGRTQGQNDVKANPNAYGVQTDVKHTVTITVKGNCGGDSRVNLNAHASVSIDGGAATTYSSTGYVSPGQYTPERVINLTV